jgi:hypothetical protein
MFFTNDPIVATVTTIQAIHLTELRQAINLLRHAAGLGDFSFTDPSPAGVTVQALHVQQMRTALADAQAALGLPPSVLTDPTITSGSTLVKAAHFQQLRDAVK